MLLHSLLIINHALFSAIYLYLSLSLVGNASPIISSQEARFDLSSGDPGIKRAKVTRGIQINHNAEKGSNVIDGNQQSWRLRRQSRDLSAEVNQDGAEIFGNSVSGLTRNPKSSEIRRRSHIASPEVIPKDPNGFFHPASLGQFKENVASFKAWKESNLTPDDDTLARSKAEDVAAKLDNFIEEISIKHAPMNRLEKTALTSCA